MNMLKIVLVLFKIYVLMWKKGPSRLLSYTAAKHTALNLHFCFYFWIRTYIIRAEANYWTFIILKSQYYTPSDVATCLSKSVKKPLVYPPSQKASCWLINFCLSFISCMYNVSIIIETFCILRPPIEWIREHGSFWYKKFSQLTRFNTDSPQSKGDKVGQR